jgi:predicted transcriptional regulator
MGPNGSNRHGENAAIDDDLALSEVQASLLRNRIRRSIVGQLDRTPGLNKNQLKKKLDLLPETLEFHLERLKEYDLVVTKPSAQDNEVLCFLERDEDLWEDEDTRILFGREMKRKVGLYVAEHPGASTAEIAEAVGLEAVTVRHHLKTLREHRVIRRIRLGRDFEYHPSDSLEDWIDQVGHNFSQSSFSSTDDPG